MPHIPVAMGMRRGQLAANTLGFGICVDSSLRPTNEFQPSLRMAAPASPSFILLFLCITLQVVSSLSLL